MGVSGPSGTKERRWSPSALLALLLVPALQACTESSTVAREARDGGARGSGGASSGGASAATSSGGAASKVDSGTASGGTLIDAASDADATESLDSAGPVLECKPIDCGDAGCAALTWPVQCQMETLVGRLIIHNWRVFAGCGYIGSATAWPTPTGVDIVNWYDQETNAFVGSSGPSFQTDGPLAVCYGDVPKDYCQYTECYPCAPPSGTPRGCTREDLGLAP